MENNIPPGCYDPAYFPEPRMKPCPECEGEGRVCDENASGNTIKVDCEKCNGTGEIEMTFEECRDEDELIRESQSDL